MYRAPLVGNRICNRKWVERTHEEHLNRLGEVKAGVDNSPPPQFSHLASRSKKAVQEEEKYRKIEYENRILLQKMSHIMSHPAVDNQLEPALEPKKSLNSVARKKELQKIMQENQKILDRIQNSKGCLKKQEWDSHAKQHDQFVRQVRDVQVITLPTPGTRSKSRSRSNTSSTQKLPPLITAPPIARPNDSVEKVLFREGKTINSRYTIVTVVESAQDPDSLSFRTYDLDSSESNKVDVVQSEIERLVREDSGLPQEEIENLLQPEHREALISLLSNHLHFTPKLILSFTDPTAVRPNRRSQSKAAARSSGTASKKVEGKQQVPPLPVAPVMPSDMPPSYMAERWQKIPAPLPKSIQRAREEGKKEKAKTQMGRASASQSRTSSAAVGIPPAEAEPVDQDGVEAGVADVVPGTELAGRQDVSAVLAQ